MATEAARSPDGGRASAVLAIVAGDLTRLLGSVQEADWDRPTPCTAWTLRDLTDHVTLGNRFTIRILGGDSSEQALTSARRAFAERHDTRQSLVSSTRQLEECFAAPGVLDRNCHHVDGDLSGLEVLRLRLHDLIIHTWDAAQALRAAPVEIRPELVNWALADIAEDRLAARHFALDLPTAGDRRSGQASLLTAFGRPVPDHRHQLTTVHPSARRVE